MEFFTLMPSLDMYCSLRVNINWDLSVISAVSKEPNITL